MKKTLTVTGSLVLALILWYLFIKPYDYLVTFAVRTSPGTIHTGIQEWGNAEDGVTIESNGFEQITQQLKAGDSTLTFNWKMVSHNDSVTRVKVYINDPEHSFRNKIAVLFTRSTIEKISINRISGFKKGLEEHLETFRVKVNGISEIPEIFCACTSIQTKQSEKAQGMMQHYPIVPDFLIANDIQQEGNPLVEITEWDTENQTIRFNFCFPIKKRGSLPQSGEVFYRALPAQKAIKSTFYGNYNSSDRAWFALSDHARRNKLTVNEKPVEIFFNNPSLGGDPLEWKTEVYMPIAEK